MAEDSTSTTGIAHHGASRLPSVDIDGFNIELKDEEGFIGDRASKGAFREMFDRWRKPLRKTGKDPFGDVPSEEISKKALDEMLVGDDTEASTPSSEVLANMSAEERAGSFHHKKVGPRAAIVAAGPIANFILATLIFAGMFLYFGKPASLARVDVIQPDSVAASSGFQVGDVVMSIDGEKTESFADMQRIVSMNPGSALVFKVKRQDGVVTLTATPALKVVKDNFGNSHKIGMLGIQYNSAPSDPKATPVGVLEAFRLGVDQVWFIIAGTFKFIGSIFAGAGSSEDLGGPLRIAQLSGQAASLGFQFLLQLCAALSVSIGLLNLFPVPLLDGGHLLFYGVEAVRGRPLSDRAQEMGFRIGLGLVLMLMVFATYNDILHLAGS